ncbi:hypothetical protein [Paracoccus sp. JM45]|uniref:hypothetical protein n=1 Tax=Paracoccus sp. JM45 TaxID=2283626 RepID=UPI000E6CAA5F|nr:hypothetical protein [Paracoccus sp. JM45]RJE81277.1 hypothetical protein DWB67_01055 [Paracoccus sp. JM45]
MTKYQFTAIRRSDGAEIDHGAIDDVLDAGKEAMTLTIMAGLLHSHPIARTLTYKDIKLEMVPAD